MAIEITIPRLGWNMEEGKFIGWLKQDGDMVRSGENLFTLEGEKATEDIECLDSGILRIPPSAPKPGDKVAVGTVIGCIANPGESVGWADSSRPTIAPTVGLEDSTHPTPTPVLAASPSVRRRARQLAAQEVVTSAVASPRARRAARELGIDWKNLQGSGRTGRIRERDVRAAAGTQYTASSIRRTIAERLQTAAHSTVPVTLTTTADGTNLVNLRNQYKSSGELVPTYTDFFVKLAATALHEHPLLNASWVDDQTHKHEEIHIGIAVDTDAGLLVPVVRDVMKLGMRQIAAVARDLVERGRAGKLKTSEMQGGTFTITNLGNYGIDAFTPIINPPQCAILGVGRIQRQPVVSEEVIIIRDIVTLSLTFDHRIVDGAPAARFLQTLVRLVENPAPALVM